MKKCSILKRAESNSLIDIYLIQKKKIPPNEKLFIVNASQNLFLILSAKNAKVACCLTNFLTFSTYFFTLPIRGLKVCRKCLDIVSCVEK